MCIEEEYHCLGFCTGGQNGICWKEGGELNFDDCGWKSGWGWFCIVTGKFYISNISSGIVVDFPEYSGGLKEMVFKVVPCFVHCLLFIPLLKRGVETTSFTKYH